MNVPSFGIGSRRIHPMTISESVNTTISSIFTIVTRLSMTNSAVCTAIVSPANSNFGMVNLAPFFGTLDLPISRSHSSFCLRYTAQPKAVLLASEKTTSCAGNFLSKLAASRLNATLALLIESQINFHSEIFSSGSTVSQPTSASHRACRNTLAGRRVAERKPWGSKTLPIEEDTSRFVRTVFPDLGERTMIWSFSMSQSIPNILTVVWSSRSPSLIRFIVSAEFVANCLKFIPNSRKTCFSNSYLRKTSLSVSPDTRTLSTYKFWSSSWRRSSGRRVEFLMWN